MTDRGRPGEAWTGRVAISLALLVACGTFPRRAASAEIPTSAEIQSLLIPGALFDHRGLVFRFPQRAAVDSTQMFALGVSEGQESGALAGIWRTGGEGWVVTSQPASLSARDQSGSVPRWSVGTARSFGSVRAAVGGSVLVKDARHAETYFGKNMTMTRQREYSAFVGAGVGDSRSWLDLSGEYSRVEAKDSSRGSQNGNEFGLVRRLNNTPKLGIAVATRIASSASSAFRLSGSFGIHTPDWRVESGVSNPDEVLSRESLYQVWDANAAYEFKTPQLDMASVWFGYSSSRDPRMSFYGSDAIQANLEQTVLAVGCALRRDLRSWLAGSAGFVVRANEVKKTIRTFGGISGDRVTNTSRDSRFSEEFGWGVGYHRAWFEADASIRSTLSLVDTFYAIDVKVAP